MRQGCEQIQIGDISIIKCGGKPSDHQCNEDLNVLILSDGNTVENTPENYEQYLKNVVGGSVGCSICERLGIDNKFYHEF